MARGGHWKPYGQSVELEIERAGPHGEGLATLDAARYRVWGSLPGERVRARIFGRKTGWRLAALEEVLRPSPARITPRCPAFLQCGGCSWQNLVYGEQLGLLETQVRGMLDEAGVVVDPQAWAPTLGSDSIEHYRGKIEMSFGGQPGEIHLGFNRRGRYWEVVDVEECHIGPPVNRAVIERVRAWANRHMVAPYRTKTFEGFLRYLVIRQGLTASPPRWLAALVTTRGDLPEAEQLVASLAEIEVPGSFMWVRSDATSQTVKVEESDLLLGDGRLLEQLGDVEYALGLESFFQANAAMARRLVEIVRARVLAETHKKIVDLFCGVGTIALALADACDEVVGVEFVAPAVADAQANAAAHGWNHVTFRQGEAEKFIWDDDTDVVVLDPPRSGLHPRLPRRLLERPVPRIVYVSCNPQALARDLALLSARYTVRFIQCVDMFPHTPHVETIVELTASDDVGSLEVRDPGHQDSQPGLGE